MPDRTGWLLLDDRLLIEHLLVGLNEEGSFHTTAYWYYRASRAAVAGAGGQLSGPFAKLTSTRQSAAIRQLLTLPADIGLPDPRSTVPLMAELSERHPKLNLLNLEAAATALLLHATVLLSSQASQGILPRVLDTELIPWRTLELD